MKKNSEVKKEVSLESLSWDKYGCVVPQDAMQRSYTTERSVFIYGLQVTLIKQFKKNSTEDTSERRGIRVPLDEFMFAFPKDGSFNYVQSKMRTLGMVVRVRKDTAKKQVFIYIEGMVQKFKKLEKLEGKKLTWKNSKKSEK